jgi:hypothetical protein
MKLAIFILCHHKPWLIRSSLLSLLSQDDNHDYDLHFILIKGNGENKEYNEYKEYFRYKSKTGEKNTQLSNFDNDVLKELKKIKIKYKIHNFKNDHGLDSGAWIKLIKSNIWKDYDYSIFLMEGFLFSSRNVLKSLKKFLIKKKPDFISSAHEKRFFKVKPSIFYNNYNKSYHDQAIQALWMETLKIKEFNKIIRSSKRYITRYGSNIQNITEHHISKYSLSLFQKIKLFIKSFIYFYDFDTKKKILVTMDRKFLIDKKQISKKYENIDGIDYHIDKNPLFYGCSCQHIFSKKMIKDTKIFFKKNNIFKMSRMPYFGEVFEIIWGLLPKVLNKRKWYFSGIHRVRKNLINYIREDYIDGMVKYLNLYNENEIKFYVKNNNIRFKEIKKKLNISKLIK